jgi:LmbE family N-acetylglucosaminyl deacetylase
LIRTIFVSPHCDDVALSVGGMIAVNFFEMPYKIVTVFSKSISSCIQQNNFSSVSKIREMEERKYAESIGAEISFLNFPDSSVREYKNDRFNGLENFDETSDSIFFDIYNSLSNIMAAYPKADIVCPLGIGNHIDHILILNICTRLCVENNRRIIYYEDLPYAALFKLKDIRMRINTLSTKFKFEIKPHKVDITNKMSYKINNLKIYKSQLTCNKYIYHVKVHSVRIGLNYEYLLDFIWSYDILRFPFKKIYIRKNSRSYEQIWLSQNN